MTTAKTQLEKLTKRLSTGKNLTVAEAKSKFGVKNLSARIHELKQQGLTIYTNKVKVRGRKVTAYRSPRVK